MTAEYSVFTCSVIRLEESRVTFSIFYGAWIEQTFFCPAGSFLCLFVGVYVHRGGKSNLHSGGETKQHHICKWWGDTHMHQAQKLAGRLVLKCRQLTTMATDITRERWTWTMDNSQLTLMFSALFKWFPVHFNPNPKFLAPPIPS